MSVSGTQNDRNSRLDEKYSHIELLPTSAILCEFLTAMLH